MQVHNDNELPDNHEWVQETANEDSVQHKKALGVSLSLHDG